MTAHGRGEVQARASVPGELAVPAGEAAALPARPGIAGRLGGFSWSRVGLPLVILGMAATFALLNPNFYSPTNLRNVARQTAILAMTASEAMATAIISRPSSDRPIEKTFTRPGAAFSSIRM